MVRKQIKGKKNKGLFKNKGKHKIGSKVSRLARKRKIEKILKKESCFQEEEI
jgi:hypothetical protein